MQIITAIDTRPTAATTTAATENIAKDITEDVIDIRTTTAKATTTTGLITDPGMAELIIGGTFGCCLLYTSPSPRD